LLTLHLKSATTLFLLMSTPTRLAICVPEVAYLNSKPRVTPLMSLFWITHPREPVAVSKLALKAIAVTPLKGSVVGLNPPTMVLPVIVSPTDLSPALCLMAA
jgi:hypothetical protein